MSLIRESIEQLCESERFPGSKGYYRSQEYLYDTIKSMGHEPQKHEFFDLPRGRCTNIFVETGPKDSKRILFGGHYDALSKSGPGADDNASAVGLCLSLLKKAPKNIPLTFVFFDVEENYGFGALHGSAAFSKFYKKALKQVIIFDLIGGALFPGFEKSYFQFGNSLPQLTHSDLDFYFMPIKFLEPIGGIWARSDYRAFRNRGIPYTFISSGTPWYYHTHEDSIDRLSFAKMDELEESLLNALKSVSNNISYEADWQQFPKFLERLSQVHELRSDVILKLKEKKSPPSRLELLRMYKNVIPTLRKLGPDLWDPAKKKSCC